MSRNNKRGGSNRSNRGGNKNRRNREGRNDKHYMRSAEKTYGSKYGTEDEIMSQYGHKKNRTNSRKVIEEVTGKLSMAAGGFGFVTVPDREDDIFIPSGKLNGALNNDTVKVAITRKAKNDHREEGEIFQIVERSKRPYIGILQITGQKAWVIMQNKNMPYDIEVPIEQVKPEYQGLKVAVLIKEFVRGQETPKGDLIDVLGASGDNNTEMHAILTEFGLPYKFSDEVENAAAKIPVTIGDAELSGRRDFRGTCTFTIDPADAKDFDDACSLKKLDNGHWEVGVHIADVSYYVRPGSIIDKEAVDRGTSVYLVDRTVPMLPEVLSNNLCSLRPGEPKLTFSAVFELDDDANVINRWFGRTIISSDFRFAYEEVQQLIESNGDTTNYKPTLSSGGASVANKENTSVNANIATADGTAGETHKVTGLSTAVPGKVVIDAVLELHKLATLLRKRRFEKGSISFERPEMKVLVDEKGKPIDIVEKISREANWLIEELMLLANKEVATYVTTGLKIKAPTFVYRIHDQPDMDKITELRTFIKHFGYTMDASDTPQQLAKALNKLLDSLKGKPECATIEILALRSMARAEYSTDNIGHYGLGFEYYTHFTSPIRRYPDMMVHRLLANYLAGGKSADKKYYEDMCQHASEREQLATEAERASVKYKMTEFMEDKIGQIYEGVISGVTDWGLYVQIEPTKVEGMVALRDIKEDYFEFDEKNYCVIGKSTHQKFTLGDKVKIKVEKTNLEQKIIDFSLVWDESYNKAEFASNADVQRDNSNSSGRNFRTNSGSGNRNFRNNRSKKNDNQRGRKISGGNKSNGKKLQNRRESAGNTKRSKR
ncbi:MAG: RNB domain-containing ribonuclease [Bacteroidales bacterium]|jgi:ribonuclease R|nr:RNB domain-containing ribonuclease [Bacteroidales bacterium]